jgi:hypothetical protein
MAQVWSRRSAAIVAVLVLLVVATVSVDGGRTFIVTDMQSDRVGGVYVAYHHEGTTFALVEAPSYRATPQSLTKSDADGRVVIPRAILLRWPLIQSPPLLNIDLIYAPSLHNGLAWVSRQAVVSRRGEFEVSPDRSLVRLADLTGDAVRWQSSLMNLEGLLRSLFGVGTGDAQTAHMADELLEHFKQEYAAILARHGDTPRPRPPIAAGLTEQERAATVAMIDKDLAARPLWRDELTRLLPFAIASLEQMRSTSAPPIDNR